MQTERFIRSFDGTELYTCESGRGLNLVLCDGLGCDGFIWRYLQPAFEVDCRVVRWHHRGHGLSHVPEDPTALSVDALCADLTAVLDSLAVDSCVLLGHSMGVQVGLEFALRHPERILGVVPICGSYGRPLQTFHDSDLLGAVFPFIHRLAARFPERAQRVWTRAMMSELSYQLAVHFEVNGSLVRRVDFEPYFRHLAAMDLRVFLTMLEHINGHSVEDRLHELHAPALIVAGERDTFTPPWLSLRMQQLLPDSDLLMVPGGSHTALIEIPELVHLRLRRFLENRIAAPKPRATRKKANKAVGNKAKASPAKSPRRRKRVER